MEIEERTILAIVPAEPGSALAGGGLVAPRRCDGGSLAMACTFAKCSWAMIYSAAEKVGVNPLLEREGAPYNV